MKLDEYPEKTAEILNTCKQYSLLSEERLRANIAAVRYVNREGIAGDIVEIGVWKGGSMLAMMLTNEESPSSRLFHLYDTFVGMTEPSDTDADFNGISAELMMLHNPGFRCISSLEEVKENISRHTGIVPQYHEGDILLNTFVPKKIAVLRLDTDWYESTKHELDTFYDSVVPGGIIIIDDYGHWKGCKKAVDEFLGVHPEIVLQTIDYTGRWFLKPLASTSVV
jgi:O-methyltransferase